MAQKTSINIKPCNTGSSEEHNKRKAEYLARINKERLYIRTDLMASNEAWVAPELGNSSLTDRYNQIARMVKEKTGRVMQTKDRERVNKKTGKVTIVRGSTPLKEGVVVINESTTMEQLQRFCEVCKERWGITPLQVFIHRDEGHYSNPQDPTTWKPNLHAHIVWDWMNHDTGKSCKLDEKAMSEMQTLLAECLEMERGISKELTGKTHLERTDFIIAKQKQEAEQAKAEKEKAVTAKAEAEAERNSIEVENKAKAERSAALDSEIADKQKSVMQSARTRWMASWIVSAVWSVLVRLPLLKRSTSSSHRNMIALKRRSSRLSSKRWRSRQRNWLRKSRKPKRSVIMPLRKVALLLRSVTGLLRSLEAKTRMCNCVSIMQSGLPMRRKTKSSTDYKMS